MGTLELVGTTWAAAIAFMTVIWIVSLLLKNAGIVDIFWGLGFIIVSCMAFVIGRADTARSVILLGAVSLWGLRLATHIGVRNWGKEEDWRYGKWREEARGQFWWRSYFKVFLLQGATMAIVALPPVLGITGELPGKLVALDVAGLCVWLFGFGFEAIGDEQLRRFRKDSSNVGKVMDSGLWRYTRHPNYFGESLIWWGFFLTAVSTPNGVWSVASPVLMTFLLVRVSGVRMLESGMKKRKPEYDEYVRRTSGFIPWPPRARRAN